ncbi:hypothetical protein GOP47_0012788 [Adiantum capillus-veneris]|uniref:Uncharacterized protein n=1 Tax=Adiantum capillus-veneris TaxID=13818 RepID=A0A9D4ZG12_ADICA|nr:hypothetical protein GOP47_0012788 [Adiantum capillus-veneris]
MVWRKRFLPATMDALATLAGMEQSFRDLTGVALNLEEAVAAYEMGDLSEGETDHSKCDIDQALLEHIRLELKHKLKEDVVVIDSAVEGAHKVTLHYGKGVVWYFIGKNTYY